MTFPIILVYLLQVFGIMYVYFNIYDYIHTKLQL